MLELRDISFHAGERKILDNISFTFEPGTTYAVLGNNGVGKSSLARIIMGLEGYKGKHQGKIFLDGVDFTDEPIYKRAQNGITLAWQEPVRFDGLSIRDYLTLGGRYKLSDSEITDLLKMVGLSPFYLFRKVDKTLSGGERKRIELASLMVLKPKVVILDEPDSGIDMMSNSMIMNVVEVLQKANSVVISITHREEIANLSNCALLLCGGKITHSGAPEEITEVYKKMCDNCSHINAYVEDDNYEVKK